MIESQILFEIFSGYEFKILITVWNSPEIRFLHSVLLYGIEVSYQNHSLKNCKLGMETLTLMYNNLKEY